MVENPLLGLDANVVAMSVLCRQSCLLSRLNLSIIVLVTDKTNKLARFHAFQSICCYSARICS